jgi:oligopeptide transport system substrate-binding protein
VKNFCLKIVFFCLGAWIFAQDLPQQRIINICAPLHEYDMNPYTASYTAEAQLFTGLYEGLFSYDPVDLSPVPSICSAYKVSRDKKSWTFTIRDEAKFSDGSEISAQDVKDSWISLLSTADAPFASLLDGISGAADFRQGKISAENVRIDVRDKKTLVVHLDEPIVHLPKILCHHAFSVVPKKSGVYSGAFVLENFSDGIISLKKNESYWDAKSVKIPGIKIFLGDDYAENAFAFNNGEFDWIMGNAKIEKIIDKTKVQFGAEFGTVYLFFKSGESIWSKKEFRDALLEAVPYDKLRENFGVQAETFIYPLPGYPEIVGISDYDQDDATFMMKKAREKYGISEDERLKLIFATTGEDYAKKWAETLQSAWDALGVDLQIQTTTPQRYNSAIQSWNADLFHYSWIGDFADPLAFLELFRGNSSLNVANFRSAEFDAYLLEASRQDNLTDRYKLMAKAEQLLLDQSEIIPVSHPMSAHLIDLDAIGGWKVNGLDLHPLKYLYIKSVPSTDLPNLVRY